MRSRISRLRLLTLLASQRQRSPSWLPVLSAKPVMLAKVIGSFLNRREASSVSALRHGGPLHLWRLALLNRLGPGLPPFERAIGGNIARLFRSAGGENMAA